MAFETFYRKFNLGYCRSQTYSAKDNPNFLKSRFDYLFKVKETVLQVKFYNPM